MWKRLYYYLCCGFCKRKQKTAPQGGEEPSVVHISNLNQFVTVLENAQSKLVVVDFFAKWCGPCKMIAPEVDTLSVQYPEVVFVKVDIDEQPEIADEYLIGALPTFVFIKKSSKLDSFQGAYLAKVREYVDIYK